MAEPESSDGVEVVPAVAGPNPAEVAHKLTALAMLSLAVDAQDKALRKHVRNWAVGTKIVLTLPNPDQPEVPYKVGEVRCDDGSVVPIISDADAFAQWVKENAREHAVVEPAHIDGPDTARADLAMVLDGVFEAATRRCTEPFAEHAATVIWDLVRTSG
jgi:hypothetical protein